MRTHGPACCLQTLVAEATHRALRRRDDSVDERLRNVVLHFVTTNKHIHHVRNVHLLDVAVRVATRLVATHTELVALLGQGARALHQLLLRTVQRRRAVQLLIDDALQAGDFDPHGRHGVGAARVEKIKLEDAGNINVAFVDDGGAPEAQAETLVEGVDVPEEDALNARYFRRIVREAVLAVEAAGEAELGAGGGKVPSDGRPGDVDGIEALLQLARLMRLKG